MLLVLVQPWGLDLDWRELSYASLALTGDLDRRRAGRAARVPPSFRAQHRRPDHCARRHPRRVADAATVETLVEELSNPDEPAVLYAITMLEALDKRNLITPLLLQHESPRCGSGR